MGQSYPTCEVIEMISGYMRANEPAEKKFVQCVTELVDLEHRTVNILLYTRATYMNSLKSTIFYDTSFTMSIYDITIHKQRKLLEISASSHIRKVFRIHKVFKVLLGPIIGKVKSIVRVKSIKKSNK